MWQPGGQVVDLTARAGRNGRSRMVQSFDIYTEHFGLTERPFSLVPDPGFLFWSPPHQRAFVMLEYGFVSRAPITLITGEIGAGKTTLVHLLLGMLDDDVRVGFIANSHGDRGELLRWVLMALSLPTPSDASYVDLFARFQEFLIGEYAAGRRVVLIFDEAQKLSREGLEELRMFTNINSGKDELLQLVLVGQPELRDTIRRPDMVQFAQRVTASTHLPAMDAQNVAAYIHHRLAVAGATRPIFTPAACARVQTATRGVPRLVNQLCDLAMVYAYASGLDHVDEALVEQVLADGTFFAGGTPVPAPAETRAEAPAETPFETGAPASVAPVSIIPKVRTGEGR